MRMTMMTVLKATVVMVIMKEAIMVMMVRVKMLISIERSQCSLPGRNTIPKEDLGHLGVRYEPLPPRISS